MLKKIAVIALVVVIIGLIGFLVMTMSSRRAHMMGGGGSALPLSAVTKDGKQVQLSAEVEAVTGKLPEGTVAQKSGDMIVTLTLNPYPSTMRQPTDFIVKLTDANGQAINDASITLDLTMPEMWMPPNQPALEFVSDGEYRTTGQFTMRGWWRIEVIVKRGGKTQSAFFDVGL
jgi:hypothetical protein